MIHSKHTNKSNTSLFSKFACSIDEAIENALDEGFAANSFGEILIGHDDYGQGPQEYHEDCDTFKLNKDDGEMSDDTHLYLSSTELSSTDTQLELELTELSLQCDEDEHKTDTLDNRKRNTVYDEKVKESKSNKTAQLIAESNKAPQNQVSRGENNFLVYSYNEVTEVTEVNSKMKPTSVVAGNILYKQALEQLATITCTPSIYVSPSKGSPSLSANKNPKQKVASSIVSPKKTLGRLYNRLTKEEDVCTRLYNQSTKKQEEGKKKRKNIEKAILKAREIPNFKNKISLKDAERLYYQGIQSLVHLDARRSEAALLLHTRHEPYLFPPELKEKAISIQCHLDTL